VVERVYLASKILQFKKRKRKTLLKFLIETPLEHQTLNKNLLEAADEVALMPKSTIKQSPNVTIIAAAAENEALGKDNDLLWHIREDLQRFKNLTCGHAIIMGRKTFESLPKALPNRTNIVVSRNQNYAAPGIILCPSIEAALEYAKEDSQPFVIGGGQIYKQALAYAQTIELTRVHQSFEADTFFPKIDSSQWEEVHRESHPKTPEQPLAYTYITYKKIPF